MGLMRLVISLLVVFLALADLGLGGVGDTGVFDGSYSEGSVQSFMAATPQSTDTSLPQTSMIGPLPIQSGSEAQGYQSQGYPAQGYAQQAYPTSGYPEQEYQQSNSQQYYPESGSAQSEYAPPGPSQSEYSQSGYPQSGYTLPVYQQSGSQTSAYPPSGIAGQYQGSPLPSLPAGAGQDSGYMVPQYDTASAPQTSGPYQEHYSPQDLGFSQPQAESFQPDGSLNFATATPPTSLAVPSSAGAKSLYWPGSVSSNNRFYVQTKSGLSTVGGCFYKGYVPLWSDVKNGGNFYLYEWYPGKMTPSISFWGWAWPGFKKGWFTGDTPGWHMLCYNSQGWSNYIYIYVWPSSTTPVPKVGMPVAVVQGQTGIYGAPTPPNPNSDGLKLPDYNQIALQPQAQMKPLGQPIQMTYVGQSACQGCPGLVYPKCTITKCNEYYVQNTPGKLSTAGGVRYGDCMPLWSKIGAPGNYWSFEWSLCSGYPVGYYCSPEIKCFGYKKAGWYQTWFRGNKPGWHILCYNSKDWSNYVYVYVWPA